MVPPSDEPAKIVPRIAPRYQFEARVTIQTHHGVATEGWVRDLSESGLGAFVARQLVVGEKVTLTLQIAESVRLVIPAVVSVSVGTRYGFRFLALSAEQRAQIGLAIQQQPAIPFLHDE